MTREDAKRIAAEELAKHGLDTQGWKFVIDTRPKSRRLGQCRYMRREIALTGWYIDKNPDHLVVDTIKHEVAHALTGPGHGHDAKWKESCLIVGALPKACKDLSEGLEFPMRWLGECPTCRKQYKAVNKPSGVRLCKCRHEKPAGKALEWSEVVSRWCIVWRMNPEHLIDLTKRTGNDQVAYLLNELSGASRTEAKKIRAKLRKLGHSGGTI